MDTPPQFATTTDGLAAVLRSILTKSEITAEFEIRRAPTDYAHTVPQTIEAIVLGGRVMIAGTQIGKSQFGVLTTESGWEVILIGNTPDENESLGFLADPINVAGLAVSALAGDRVRSVSDSLLAAREVMTSMKVSPTLPRMECPKCGLVIASGQRRCTHGSPDIDDTVDFLR